MSDKTVLAGGRKKKELCGNNVIKILSKAKTNKIYSEWSKNIEEVKSLNTRWFKYDRDRLWLVYTQIVPVMFEPPCISVYFY
jgi:hypothetical protein